MLHLTHSEFLRNTREHSGPPPLVVVPNSLQQRRLSQSVGWIRVIRRDQWIDSQLQRPSALLRLSQEWTWTRLCVESLGTLLKLPKQTLLSVGFSQKLFQFYDEILLAGIWSDQAIDYMFERLPETPLYHDLHGILRVLHSQREKFRAPRDGPQLLQQMESNFLINEPITFYGFQKFWPLEWEIIKQIDQACPVCIVEGQRESRTPPRRLRLFSNPESEYRWIKKVVDQYAVRAASEFSIGIVVPPEPEMRRNLLALFRIDQVDDSNRTTLRWILQLLDLWKWKTDPLRLTNPEPQFGMHPLTHRLCGLLQSTPGELLSSNMSFHENLRGIYQKLKVVVSDQDEIIRLYTLLELFDSDHDSWQENPHCVEAFLRYSLGLQSESLPPPLAYGNVSLHFLDHRSASDSDLSLIFAPSLNQNIYPPPLPENIFLPEYLRKRLTSGELALQLFTHEDQLAEERVHLQRILTKAFPSRHVSSPATTMLTLVPTPSNTRPRHLPGPNANPYGKPALLNGKAHSNPNLVLGATEVETYARCPYRYYLERVQKIEEKRDEIDIKGQYRGRILHAWLELELSRKKPVDLPALEVLCQHHWPETFHASPLYFRHLANRLFREWSPYVTKETQRVIQSQRKPFSFEERFGPVPISAGLSFKGRVDRIDSTPDGFIIVDYKTGKKDLTKKDFQGEGTVLQPFVYALSLEKVLPKPVSAIEYVFLSDPEPVVLFEPKNILPRLQALAEGIRKSDFQPLPSSKAECRRCPFQPSCPTGIEI